MIMESFVKIFTILMILGVIYGADCTAPESLDFYSLTAKDIQGNEMSLEQYKGKVRHSIDLQSQAWMDRRGQRIQYSMHACSRSDKDRLRWIFVLIINPGSLSTLN
jgi:hypothetical protein